MPICPPEIYLFAMAPIFIASLLYFRLGLLPKLYLFLGATEHLYNWLFPLVGRLDDPHVAPTGLLGLVLQSLPTRNLYILAKI